MFQTGQSERLNGCTGSRVSVLSKQTNNRVRSWCYFSHPLRWMNHQRPHIATMATHSKVVNGWNWKFIGAYDVIHRRH